jgi:glutathione S-transferase
VRRRRARLTSQQRRLHRSPSHLTPAAAFGAARSAASAGPFFLGAQPSAADVLVYPWAARVPALAAWRGFAVPTDAPEFAPWHAWVAAMAALPPVARTLRDDAFYAKGYEVYATGARK